MLLACLGKTTPILMLTTQFNAFLFLVNAFFLAPQLKKKKTQADQRVLRSA